MIAGQNNHIETDRIADLNYPRPAQVTLVPLFGFCIKKMMAGCYCDEFLRCTVKQQMTGVAVGLNAHEI